MLGFVRVFREYERAVFFRFGRLLDPPRGPGLVWKIPIVDQIVKVDLRTITLNVPPQDVITKDNVPAKVDAVAYFKVVDPKSAIVQVADFMAAHVADRTDDAPQRAGPARPRRAPGVAGEDQWTLQNIIDEPTEPWGVRSRSSR